MQTSSAFWKLTAVGLVSLCSSFCSRLGELVSLIILSLITVGFLSNSLISEFCSGLDFTVLHVSELDGFGMSIYDIEGSI